MIARTKNHQVVKTAFTWNSLRYSSSLGVVKKNVVRSEANYGFSASIVRIVNSDESGLALINLF